MKCLHRIGLIAALFISGLIANDLAAAEARQPNVVFFLVDDLGWADVGCYGSRFYETPNIDRLATEGVRFTDAYAACHVCSPTRASILTGKYPATLNLTDWLPGRRNFPFQRFLNAKIKQHLPYEETTIAEALNATGYSTAIFGKWHPGRESSTPLKHGFDFTSPMSRRTGARSWPLRDEKPGEQR